MENKVFSLSSIIATDEMFLKINCLQEPAASTRCCTFPIKLHFSIKENFLKVQSLLLMKCFQMFSRHRLSERHTNQPLLQDVARSL
jgi:hypothetical protein